MKKQYQSALTLGIAALTIAVTLSAGASEAIRPQLRREATINPSRNSTAPRRAQRPTQRPTNLATKSTVKPGFVDRPICYAQMPGSFGTLTNLNKLCGVDKKKNLIDLSIDVDRDGVPDQLLAAMQTFNQKLNSAQSPQDYEAAMYALEDSLPYSDSVKSLQVQQRQLQKQLATAGNATPLYQKLDTIQQQIYKDPTYTQIQTLMSKVYAKLNR
jgi:hypothetical protein